MTKKMQIFLALLLALSMVLGACAPAAPAEVTEEPVVAAEPTTAPVVVEEPATDLDPQTLFAALIEGLPADKGYGTIAAAKLNEELVEKPAFLLDVREAAEIEKDGFLAGAVNIPVRELLTNLDKLPGLDEPIVIYCASGHRGGMAMAALKLLGYTNVRNLAGGLGGWKKAGLPVETGKPADAAALSTPIVSDQALFDLLNGFFTAMPDDFYSIKSDKLSEELADKAPILLDVRTADEFGKDGHLKDSVNMPLQEIFNSADKLPADKDAAIVIYCVSGHRGSIATMGLRLMGYTNIRNLAGGLNAWKAANLPVEGWVNWPVVWSEYLTAMPEGFYTVKAADLNTELVEKAPFLLDVRETGEIESTGFIAGAINIPVREVLANLDKLPAQDQSIVIYCASGHRGAMVMTALQMLGYTNVRNLAGGLGAWTKAELPVVTGEKPAAPATGTAPEVDKARLDALNKFLSELPEGFFTVKAADFNVELTGTPVPFIIDVRSAEEFAAGYIQGAVNIKIQDVPASLAQLPADKAAPVVVLCQSGHRGAIVMMYLRMTGYTNVRNLAGGMNAWAAAELPVVK